MYQGVCRHRSGRDESSVTQRLSVDQPSCPNGVRERNQKQAGLLDRDTNRDSDRESQLLTTDDQQSPSDHHEGRGRVDAPAVTQQCHQQVRRHRKAKGKQPSEPGRDHEVLQQHEQRRAGCPDRQ